MNWCMNCPANNCVNNPSAVYNTTMMHVNKKVSLYSSLYTMKRSTLSTKTNKDKKNFSYDRYLAKKRGEVISYKKCTRFKTQQTNIHIYN